MDARLRLRAAIFRHQYGVSMYGLGKYWAIAGSALSADGERNGRSHQAVPKLVNLTGAYGWRPRDAHMIRTLRPGSRTPPTDARRR